MAERTTDRNSRAFDPRFSPEFQPGYDARVHGEAPSAVTRAAATRETPPSLITRASRGGSTQSTDAYGSAPGSGDSARDPDTAADTPVANPAANLAEGAADLDETLDVDAAAPWWRRLNPYLVVLGVLGVAILLGALALLQAVYGTATNPYTQQLDYILVQFAMFGAPVMIALGIAILASIPAILALRWRR